MKLLILLSLFIFASCEGGGENQELADQAFNTGENINDTIVEQIEIATDFQDGDYRSNCEYIGGSESRDYKMTILNDRITIVLNTFSTGNCEAGNEIEYMTFYFEDENQRYNYAEYYASHSYLYYDTCGITLPDANLPTVYIDGQGCYLTWENLDLVFTGNYIEGYTVNNITFTKL